MPAQLARWFGMIGLCGLLAAAERSWVPTPAPDVETAVGHWTQTRAWTTALNTHTGLFPTADTHGVQIILRHRGRLVGSAWALGAVEDDPLHVAARTVLSRALADPAIASLPEHLQREAFARLSVEVETAGPLVPLTAPTLAEAAADMHPGRDGIAVRIGDRWDARFPAHLRSAGAAATIDEIEGMALVAGMVPAQFNQARRSGDAVLYRFATVDLVQCTPVDHPRQFSRGGVDAWSTVSRDSLRDAAQRITRHVLKQCWKPLPDGPMRIPGTYLPHADRYDPVVADDASHLLMATALVRISRQDAIDADLRHRAAQAGAALAADLTADTPASRSLRAAAQREGVPGVVMSRDDIESLVRDDSAPLAARAIAAWSIADDDRDGHVRALLDHAASMPPDRIADALPYIAWAHERLADTEETSSRLADTLSGLLVSFEDRQLIGGSDGTHGGIAMDRTMASVNARTLRPAAWMAGSPETASSHHALAFLQGLIVTNEQAACMREPARTVGGVRFAPWDERQAPWAQALALLALDRALDSMPSSTLDH